ncbi:MAG: TIGR02281 family clan AA aspartic protease [Sphingomonas sp.]|nr:TIGR02281 family clan AA aspartic protease [Sphingomonas sp.]
MSMGKTLFWAGAILIGAALLAPGLPGDGDAPVARTPVPARPAAPAPIPTARAGNGSAGQTISRAEDGHFYAEAQVNGARIRFLVDTGASLVALTPEDARRAGIAIGDVTGRAQGAGGEVAFAPVTIDRLAIGPLEARDVRGAVADRLPVSLLGQSFLQRVGSVEMRGDTMILR